MTDKQLASFAKKFGIVFLINDWKSVKKDGYPEGDEETIFVGINTAGFCGCFNWCSIYGECAYETAEATICIMDNLEYWKVLGRPDK